MDYFWQGFFKKASLDEWQRESEEADKENTRKNKVDTKIDPVALSSSFTPDTYWRSWP